MCVYVNDVSLSRDMIRRNWTLASYNDTSSARPSLFEGRDRRRKNEMPTDTVLVCN